MHARLDAGVRAPLTLLGAPAGWGKTVLLSSWLRAASRGGPVAWLSLEPDDGGPRFWRYLHATLTSSGVPLADVAEEEAEPAQFASALTRLPEPVVLVLDDLDQVGDGGVLDGVDFLLRHAGDRLRLVVAARTDPALALHRWRVRGELTELRATDLAFTVAETAQLLAGHGLAQPDAYAGELRTRAEGWPAGERLAALSMMEAPDPARFLPRFTGDDSRVAEYLRGEVLARQPAEVRDVLLHTSVLRQVCGGLVEALTGRTDGERILAELDRSSAFLVPLEGRPSWRRHHRLFGELLRAELRRQSPDRVPELHRRASSWLAAHGRPADALRHALAATDFPQATGVLVAHWPELVGHGHDERVPATPPPAEAVRADPELALAYAVDRLDRGDPDGAGRLLRLAERHRHLLPPGRRDRFTLIAAALRLGHAQSRGDLAALAPAAARMLALLGPHPQDSPAAIASTGLGTARLAAGELAAAQDALAEGLVRAERAGLCCPRLACASRLAFTQALRGQLGAAEGTARAALASPDCPSRPGTTHCGFAYLALAIVDIERGRLAQAEANLASAADPADALLCAWASLVQARLLGERGEPAQAHDALRTARQRLGESPATRYLEHCFAAAEAELRIGDGDTRTARKLLGAPHPNGAAAPQPDGAVAPQPDGAALVAACLARAYLQDGDPAAAIHALPDWAGDGAGGYPVPIRLDAGLTEAMATRRLGEARRSRDALERVLQLAEPDGHRRALLRPGARELLLDHLDSGTAYWSTVADLLSATATGGPQGQPGPEPGAGEPLTDRELAVLRYLPSMLSNGEIATSLCLSVNTVKTHVRHIYRKLHATRRREAVRRARELHLL